eukprot:849316_1
MSATDEQIAEKDPLTGIFPFMLAAADRNSDLTAVFKLLRRNPAVIGDLVEEDKSDGTIRSRKRKLLVSEGGTSVAKVARTRMTTRGMTLQSSRSS